MSFSQSCASNVVPLMARLVLGAAFIYAGWAKVFTDRTWTGEDANTLRQMGVSSASSSASAGSGVEFRFASWSAVQDVTEPGEGAIIIQEEQDQQTGGGAIIIQEEQDQQIGDVEGTQDEPPTDEPEAEQAPPVVPGPGGDLRARKLYDVALKVHEAGLEQYETAIAWGTALVELVGGALILIGLFSRIWGLALAVIMAGAFYTTSWPGFSADPYGFLGENFDLFVSQVGRFVLAFGVFLTGPGAISADRMLFRHGHDEEPDVDLT